MIDRKDIDRLIAQNGAVIEFNTNYPNLESSGWKWKKYADGTVEAWYKKIQDIAITSASEDNFQGVATVTFPFGIYDAIPNVDVFTATSASGWVTWGGAYQLKTESPNTSLSYFIWTPTSTTRNCAICAHITGRWK